MGVSRRLQFVLIAGITLWVAALFLVPGAMFPIGRYVCHQRPERSFFVHGLQMPVCARCTGLYMGALFAAPLGFLIASSFTRTRLTSARARLVLAAAALPTLLTWTLEFAGFAHFSNVARFVAALPLGLVAAWLVLGVLEEDRP